MPAEATAPQPKYYGIQVLRGLAAVLVVLHHQVEASADLFRSSSGVLQRIHGASGVDIFFPISGFVMYLTAAAAMRRGGDWRTFAWRRVARVAPLYWLCTLLKLALFALAPSLLVYYRFRLWNALAAFVFLPVYNYMHQPEPPLVVGWTLSYEMLFYTLLTAALALRKPLLTWASASIGVLALLGLFVPHRWGAFTYLADPIELEFLAGMFLAAYAARLRAVPAWLAWMVLLGSGAWLIWAPVPVLEFQPARVLYWGIPGALMVASAVALEHRLDLSGKRLLLLLGDASYSLYLTHTFVVPAVRTAVRHAGYTEPERKQPSSWEVWCFALRWPCRCTCMLSCRC